LIAFGLLTDHGKLVLIAVYGAVWQASIDEYAAAWIRQIVPPAAWFMAPSVIIMILVGGFALLKVLSVAWALVTLFGFSVTRQGDDLRTTLGLITRRSATVPTDRIQWVAVVSTPLQRLLGLVTVQGHTAGGGLAGENALARKWLAPLLPLEDLPRLLRDIQPELTFDHVIWEPVDRGAERRIIRGNLWRLFALAAVVAVWNWRGGLLLTLFLIVPAFVAARLRARALGYAVATDAVVLRDGWWTRQVAAIRLSKIQTSSLRQSPFDRRYRMATVSIDTIGERALFFPLRVPFLGARTARALVGRLSRLAESPAPQ
jgi:putative membrane protein